MFLVLPGMAFLELAGITGLYTFILKLLLLPVALLMQGCIVATVVEVAAETVEAGVEVTGAVVGGVVDVVTPDDDEDEDEQNDRD